MARGFYQDVEQLLDPEDFREFIGISLFDNLRRSKELRTTTVRVTEEFRPDKIAKRLYQTEDIAWTIAVVNDFEHGFKEYTKNKTIQYVSPEGLVSLGLL